MLKYGFLILVLFVVSLAVVGCQKTTSVNDGSGFEALTPSSETRSFIITNDQPFARQVAGHNRTCAAQPGCRK